MWMWIVILTLLLGGCHYQKSHGLEEKAIVPKVDKLVVFGFRSALSQGEAPDVVRSPLSGAVFMAEPVHPNVAHKMTNRLFNRLIKEQRYDLVSPAQARGVFSSLVASDLISSDIEVFRKIGKTFSADAVLTGHIFRWREREGTDYAVNRPASVAFDLYLIRPADGAFLWKGRFDKTQRSLTENLLDMNTFVRGGGKWMNAENLAAIGLDDLLGDLVRPEIGKKD